VLRAPRIVLQHFSTLKLISESRRLERAYQCLGFVRLCDVQ
jgi:hypothetical protein